MAADRVLSLAAGAVLDLTAEATVDAAARAGFDAVGIWYDPATWSSTRTREVAKRLRATGLLPLDIEAVILGRGHDPGDEVVDTAAEIGARHVLVAGGPAEPAAVADRLAALCDRAAGSGVVVVLEFLPIFTVSDLPTTLDIVAGIQRSNAAILVDSLHLARSGGAPHDLHGVPEALLPYLQIADAPAAAPSTPAALREEAVDGRLLPGEGALPLSDLIRSVPAVPLSFEIRSRALREQYPDPVERARAIRTAALHFMTALSSDRE